MTAQIVSTVLQTIQSAKARWTIEQARADRFAAAGSVSNTQLMDEQGLLY